MDSEQDSATDTPEIQFSWFLISYLVTFAS